MNSSSLYRDIVILLIGNVIAIVSNIFIARYSARYSRKLAITSDTANQAQTKTTSDETAHAEEGDIDFDKSLKRFKVLLFFVDIAALVFNAWYLWRLILLPSMPTREDVFSISFYTLITLYWGNRVLNDILDDSVVDQIRRDHRNQKYIHEDIKTLYQINIRFQEKIKQLEAKEQTQLPAKPSKGKTAKLSQRNKGSMPSDKGSSKPS